MLLAVVETSNHFPSTDTFSNGICRVDNMSVHFQVWDTTAGKTIRDKLALYCRRTQIFIVMYDITNRVSGTMVTKSVLMERASTVLQNRVDKC